ncbi:MAG: preprotein translocase subunit SecG [SAR202 cluster bacterium Casp-Chloro-G4]|nr:preprotein translocase subunit SecG [Chloroflexota bacterium]MDA1228034.1 preprotein translocase subunit SecG [Chloroflexota bacterium]PKB61661.1 MAG: preprotein translocase subunit SecG [SAR202 cluster bacterium Casp-Chloro-G4]
MAVVNIIQILVSVILIAVILIQIKGQGSGFFGAAESSYHTRRGMEKTLFQFTIFMVVVFIGISIVSVRFNNFLTGAGS